MKTNLGQEMWGIHIWSVQTWVYGHGYSCTRLLILMNSQNWGCLNSRLTYNISSPCCEQVHDTLAIEQCSAIHWEGKVMLILNDPSQINMKVNQLYWLVLFQGEESQHAMATDKEAEIHTEQTDILRVRENPPLVPELWQLTINAPQLKCKCRR